MKIHMKISENHKKGNKHLSSFWISWYRPDFLGVLCFVSGCGNTLVGHFLISVGQDWSKTYNTGNLWTAALVLTLGFVEREIQNGSFEVFLSINLTGGRFVDTPLFRLSWGSSGSVNFTTMFTNPFCLTYLTG